MHSLKHFVITLAAVVTIKGGLSAGRMAFRYHGHSMTGHKFQDKITTDEIRRPSIINKDNAFSSFAYNIPVRHKLRSLHLRKFAANYGKRTVHGTENVSNVQIERVGRPLSSYATTDPKEIKGVRQAFKLPNNSISGTTGAGQMNNVKIERVGRPLLSHTTTKFKKIKDTRQSLNLLNDSITVTTGKGHMNDVAYEMVGQPLFQQSGTKLKKIEEMRHQSKIRNYSSIGISSPEIVKTGKPLMLLPENDNSGSLNHGRNPSGKDMEFEDDHDDEFAKESYKVNTSDGNRIDYNPPANSLQAHQPGQGKSNPVTTVTKVNAPFSSKQRKQQPPNNMLDSFLASVHNTTTSSSLQGFKNPIKQQVNQSNDKPTSNVSGNGYFQNTTIPKGEGRVPVINLNFSQKNLGNFYGGGQSSKVLGVNSVDEIAKGTSASESSSASPSVGMSPTEVNTQEMTTVNPQLKYGEGEQTVASDKPIYLEEQVLQEGQNKGASFTNYRISNINDHEQSEENTERYNSDSNDLMYNFQRDDDNNNEEDDQGGFLPGFQYAANYLSSPPSVQGYMPVDEFGSPFYGNETDEYFQREALMAHNKYRSVHNAPPLELDPQLSIEAEQLAQLLTKPDGARKKVDMENEGENIARGCSEWGGLTASGAVHRWYSEVCRYDWTKREIQPKAKDFMQLVWRGTRKVGIGRALTDLHGLPCAFIVALYRPGKINPLDIERNIGPGLFAPSYCNADGDESLLSTGYPSSFATRDSKSDQRALYQENDNLPPSAKSLKDFQVAAEDNSGITFVPLSSFEKELDDQDAEGVLKEQPDIKSPNRFLPHISYVQTPDNFVAMDADDIGVKRDKGPLKEVKPYY